ncbi:MAG: nickel transporter permease [Limnochordia bacterium]|jgi:peptide/nickel transport system permease protein|nr:ABC transporter permease [Limnochordia bacterium]MDI9465494.1 ABC transporter permease [Bacillota bacterium]NLO96131.1 ABC transporter permease [Bacillota bacterium]HOB41247.1 ABC transporter permease [Limnochordia bacterium]HOK32598.1 ABC transporter permease [Limnochordia bacterium]
MAAELEVSKTQSQFRRIMKQLLRNRRAVVGGIVLLIIVFMAILAPYVTTHDPVKQNIRNQLQPPSREHFFGTDQFGRDIYSRVIYGARLSLRVGFLAISFALVVGCFLGLVSGYYGGWLDMIVMRVIDILLALPGFLLALSIVAALGPGLENVIMAIGVSYIPSFARMMRSAVLATRELDYVDAAQALGASDWRIIFQHILPNSISPIIVLTTLSMAGAILSAAGLSFLGMGAQPPTPEWGSMIATARPFIRVSHWAVTVPGLAIFITVMCLNLVGDGLRDALDPRLKNLG